MMFMRTTGFAVLATAILLLGCSTDSDTSGKVSAGGSTNLGAPGTGGAVSGNPQAAAPGSEQDLQQNVGDRVFFETDQSGINDEGRKVLQRQADWLRRYPNVTITIEGHCDERGTREYNLALGDRRAASAKQVLVALGVNPNRIQTITYGKERPQVVGSEASAWAQNRRAVTVVN
jgi:peptidoglycan-associated lipoprotein